MSNRGIRKQNTIFALQFTYSFKVHTDTPRPQFCIYSGKTTANLGRAGRLPRILSIFGEWAQMSLSNESPQILHNGPSSSTLKPKCKVHLSLSYRRGTDLQLWGAKNKETNTCELYQDKLDQWLWEWKHIVIKRSKAIQINQLCFKG